LICAALIGRRVFVFTAAIVAVTVLVKRLRQDEPVFEEAPPFDAPAVLRSVPAPDTTFEAPRGHVAILPAGVSELYESLAGVIVGQRDAIETLMLALIAGGHALLEGPPGLAKTLACRTLARRIDATFARRDHRIGDFRSARSLIQGPVGALVCKRRAHRRDQSRTGANASRAA